MADHKPLRELRLTVAQQKFLLRLFQERGHTEIGRCPPAMRERLFKMRLIKHCATCAEIGGDLEISTTGRTWVTRFYGKCPERGCAPGPCICLERRRIEAKAAKAARSS